MEIRFIPEEYTVFKPEVRENQENPLDDPEVAELPTLFAVARMVGLRVNRVGKLE